MARRASQIVATKAESGDGRNSLLSEHVMFGPAEQLLNDVAHPRQCLVVLQAP